MQPLYSLHLSTAKTWRGGENQIFLLASGLALRDNKVLVVAPPGSPLLERCIEAKIPTHALKIREVDPFGLVKLMKLLRRERPQILHLHDGHAVLPGQLAARTLSPAKTKVVAHRRTVFKMRSKWKYAGRVNRVVAISKAAKECVIAAGIAPERVSVVYSGLEFSPANQSGLLRAAGASLRETLKLAPETQLIVHAAALTKEKRHVDMLHALAIVRQTLKDKSSVNVQLALAGSGVEEQNLRELARTLGLADCVHFLGFLRDVTPLWGAGCMALYASEAEGLCTALIEAQAACLPAIVTRAGGMVEVVEEGITGRCVDIGDRNALAERMIELLTNDVLRKAMGLAARERARRLFSADAMVDGMDRVYRELWA